MSDMFIRINEIWRRFFNLPMSDEFLDLKLKEVMEADKKSNVQIGEHNLDVNLAQQYCCTIFWDIDDPRKQPDKSRTVTSQKMCDDWRASCGAKGSRPLLKGPC